MSSSQGGTRRLLDPRLRILIENNVKKNHRSFIVLVGDRGRDRVLRPLLDHTRWLKTVILIDTWSLLPLDSCQGQAQLEAQCPLVLQKRPWLQQVSQLSLPLANCKC